MSKTGEIVAGRVVSGKGDLTLISRDGVILRTAIKNIPQLGRATRGVKVMSFKGDDVVASVAVLAPKEKDTSTNNGGDELEPSPLELTQTTSDISTNGQGD